MTRSELVSEVEHFIGLGVSAHDTAKALRLKPRSVYDMVRKAGREDLAQHFSIEYSQQETYRLRA